MSAAEQAKIVHVDIEGGFGGSSRSLLELVVHLKEAFPLQYVIMRRDGPVAKKYWKENINFEINNQVFSRIPLRSNNWKNILTGILTLHRLFLFSLSLLRQQPKLVHLNHDGLMFVAMVIKLYDRDIKIISHSRYKWPRNNFSRFFAKVFSFGSDKIIAISQEVSSSLQDMGVPPNKINIQFNSSKMSALPYMKTEKWQPRDRIKICFFGTINEIKYPSGLIGLAHQLKSQQVPFEIRIFGQPPRRRSYTRDLLQEQKKLEIAAQEFGGDYRFLVLGHTKFPEREIACANFVIRPSSLNDPWGRDVIETLSSGRVIIATGSNSEFIKSGENGFLIGNWDASKVAEIILSLRASPDQYEQICKRAYDDAQKLFLPSVAAERFNCVINELLNG